MVFKNVPLFSSHLPVSYLGITFVTSSQWSTVAVFMIMIIYQQGNEFSESIYTPEEIKLRCRHSLKSFNNTPRLHFIMILHPVVISFIIWEPVTKEIILIPLIVCKNDSRSKLKAAAESEIEPWNNNKLCNFLRLFESRMSENSLSVSLALCNVVKEAKEAFLSSLQR